MGFPPPLANALNFARLAVPKFGYLLGGAEPTNFCVLLVIFRFGVVPCTLAVHGPRAELSLATTRSTRNNNSNSSFVVEATCFNFCPPGPPYVL